MAAKRFIPLFLFMLSLTGFALNLNPGDPKTANEKFRNGNYEEALEEYLSLLEKESKNELYNYRVGICYLNSNINKAKAIPYLERVAKLTKTEFDAWYLLGRAYQFAYRFDDAVNAFTKFKEAGKGTAANLQDVDRQIQFCFNARELMKFPVNVEFENLGKNVNSEFRDFFGFVPVDESFLVFNSKRPEGNEEKNPDGTYNSKIYISKVKDGVFQPARYLGPLVKGKVLFEEVIGLSSAGDIMLIYAENLDGSGDIYISYADAQKNFKTATKLPESVNSRQGNEIAACISPDGNSIYFASDRSGGLGGTDLYVVRKLPNGKWGTAMNLGPGVNTPQNEDFPNLSPDGKTLYFSSSGHTSMGGYDIFKADWDETAKTFSGAKNIGYPINTPEDNMNFRISESGRYGYIGSLMEKGFGDYDLYRATFKDVEPEYTVFKGNIFVKNEGKAELNYSDVLISVTDITGEIFGNYSPNPNTGRYVVILPPGEYELSVEAPGFKPVVEKLKVLDKSSFTREVEKAISLIQAQ
jgi:tetratricopeptide (TPR) repeat protein